MPFNVPKFIEREAKIVGPLTLKQFFFFLGAGAVSFIAYLVTRGRENVFLLLAITALAVVFSAFLAFGNISGRPFPVFLKNMLFFSITRNFFTFKKKVFAPKLFPEDIPKLRESLPLKPTKERTALQKLSTKVETKSR